MESEQKPDHEIHNRVLDTVTLRFEGTNEDGTQLHELRASHVSNVLEGLVEFTEDFEKAGVFHLNGPVESEVLVRPAQEGSFLIEVVRMVTENWDVISQAGGLIKDAGVSIREQADGIGVPTTAALIWWATKSLRAEPENFEYLENGNVKVLWQDKTVSEIPPAAWEELNKRKPRRKKQLRKIMAPLEDGRVKELDVKDHSNPESEKDQTREPQDYTLDKADFVSVKPDDQIEEDHEFFEIEAQMGAIDFDDPAKWRVKTNGKSRTATVEDEDFLEQVSTGLAISKDDIFNLSIREDRITKNGRTRKLWTVLQVKKID